MCDLLGGGGVGGPSTGNVSRVHVGLYVNVCYVCQILTKIAVTQHFVINYPLSNLMKMFRSFAVVLCM
jgi:hypothetical protein